MAGRTDGVGLNQQGVAVAVGEHLAYVQEMAAGFAFGPELLTRTGKEGNATFRSRFAKGFAVHIAQHEDLKGSGILYDDRQKAICILA